jgi:hypothetical protein
VCSDAVASFSCMCPQGWQGQSCQTSFPYPIGNREDFGGSSTFGLNYLLGWRIHVPATSTLRRFGLISRTAGVHGKYALYGDVGGVPGTLVTQIPSQTLVVGVNEFGTPPTTLAAGYYWFMGVYDGQPNIAAHTMSGTGVETKYITHTFANAIPLDFPPMHTTYVASLAVNWWVVVEPQ